MARSAGLYTVTKFVNELGMPPPVSAKTPLILLPGLLCDEALWAPQIAALSDLATSRVADLTQDDSLVAMARRVLDVAPARFALAGISMGGGTGARPCGKEE